MKIFSQNLKKIIMDTFDFLAIANELQSTDPKSVKLDDLKKKLKEMENFCLKELISVSENGMAFRWNSQDYKMAQCHRDILNLLRQKFQRF